MRVAVIGARTRRQGIGGHLARFLAGAGATVVAVAGTTPASAEEAATALATLGLPRPRAHADAFAMLATEPLDAVTIASPHDTHAPYLEAALERGLHVLCEKPLCWGGDDPAATAARLARGFQARGLHLLVNAQWPWTIPTYRALFPRSLLAPPREFSMLLCPRTAGAAAIPDALPHPLSLLLAVLPDRDAEVRAPSVRLLDPAGERTEIRFEYRSRGWRVEALLETRRMERQPRPSSYGFDGRVARRVVEPEGYRLFLEAEGRRLPLPDPTPLLVAEFVRRVSSGAPPEIDLSAVPGARLLAAVAAAAPMS